MYFPKAQQIRFRTPVLELSKTFLVGNEGSKHALVEFLHRVTTATLGKANLALSGGKGSSQLFTVFSPPSEQRNGSFGFEF